MSEKIKVIYIDDEPDLCLLVKANLEEAGQYNVLTTSDPLTAEDLCLAEKPDIILLDNVMPKKKGSDIIRGLKAKEETKRIPIIMVSGKGEMVFLKKKGMFQWLPNNPAAKTRGQIVEGKNSEAMAQAYGVECYMSKPFVTQVLIDTMTEILAKAARRKEESSNGS